MREHKKMISDMRSKFTERNNELVRAHDQLRAEKKQAVQAATAAAHEIRRLSLLLKLSEEKQAKSPGLSGFQEKAALSPTSSSEGSASTILASEDDGKGRVQQSAEREPENDKENQIGSMPLKAPSSKKVIKLRIKLRKPLEPTCLDPIPEEFQALGSDDSRMKMDGDETPQTSSESEELGFMPVSEHEGCAEDESYSKSMMDLVIPAVIGPEDFGESHCREQPLQDSLLPVQKPLARVGYASEHIVHSPSKNVTTRRGKSEHGALHGDGMAPDGTEQLLSSRVFAGELHRQERHRKRNRQDDVFEGMASRGKEAVEGDEVRAQNGDFETSSLQKSQLQMICERPPQEHQDQEQARVGTEEGILESGSQAQNSEGRPRRRQTITSYVEPSLSQKLRQGDLHTFNSGGFECAVCVWG